MCSSLFFLVNSFYAAEHLLEAIFSKAQNILHNCQIVFINMIYDCDVIMKIIRPRMLECILLSAKVCPWFLLKLL